MNRRDYLCLASAFVTHASVPSKGMRFSTSLFVKGEVTSVKVEKHSVVTPSLNLAFEQTGPNSGQPIILLHGVSIRRSAVRYRP